MSQSKTSSTKILVVDDDESMIRLLQAVFRDDYEVLGACSVKEGLRTLRDHIIDLVLMDIRMPGDDGIVGLKEIRKKDPCLPVIMMSGSSEPETVKATLSLGADGFLAKPYRLTELTKLVQNCLRLRELTLDLATPAHQRDSSSDREEFLSWMSAA